MEQEAMMRMPEGTDEQIQRQYMEEAALADIQYIQQMERINNRFKSAADAEAERTGTEHPESLFIRKHKDGYSVNPIALTDADNIPIQPNDILFDCENRYCRVSSIEQIGKDMVQIQTTNPDTFNGCADGEAKLIRFRHRMWTEEEKHEYRKLKRILHNYMAETLKEAEREARLCIAVSFIMTAVLAYSTTMCGLKGEPVYFLIIAALFTAIAAVVMIVSGLHMKLLKKAGGSTVLSESERDKIRRTKERYEQIKLMRRYGVRYDEHK